MRESGDNLLGDYGGQQASPNLGHAVVCTGGIEWWKRPLDCSLVVVSSPLWLLVGLLCIAWIKAVSRGPVLFRQQRVGYRARTFTLLKFRTMREGADTKVHESYLESLIEDGVPMTKLDRDDPRLIRGAKLIRALGLDELPQLINVLRGEMSIVGPRPCTPQEMQKFRRPYYRRFGGLPGLTGSWQVNGKNSTTFRRMIALDIVYLRRASIVRDLAIIARTPLAIVAGLLERVGQVSQVAEVVDSDPPKKNGTAAPAYSSTRRPLEAKRCPSGGAISVSRHSDQSRRPNLYFEERNLDQLRFGCRRSRRRKKQLPTTMIV